MSIQPNYQTHSNFLGDYWRKLELWCDECKRKKRSIRRTRDGSIIEACEACGTETIFVKPPDPPKANGHDRDSNTNFGPGISPPPRDKDDPGAQPPPRSEPAGNSKRRRKREYRGLMLSATFLSSMKPPAYLIRELLLKGSTYLLTGNTGHCKTLLALLMAIRVAMGGGFFGKDCKQGTVVFMAGENADNVKMQFYSMCTEMDIDGPSLPILWHEGVFSIEDAKQRLRADLLAHPDIALVIYDSLQAFFEGDDDNDNVEALETIVKVRALTEGHPNRPVNLVLAHPVKRASKDNLLPRGGSSVVNESDGVFTSWLADAIGEFHWQGKLRGKPFDPLKFETIVVRPKGLVDEDGNQMPCTVVKPIGPGREAEMRTAIERRRTAIMKAIEENPMVSQNTLAPMLGVSRGTVQDDFKALKEDKLIEDVGKGYYLTKKGKKVLEMEAQYG